MGLESLNENLTEVRAELVFAQRQLQFKPPLEELRASYYRETKKFVSIPNAFGGFGDGKVRRECPPHILGNTTFHFLCFSSELRIGVADSLTSGFLAKNSTCTLTCMFVNLENNRYTSRWPHPTASHSCASTRRPRASSSALQLSS